jgi:hypothetical protein
MATVCSSFARARVMRLTRLDECGIPVDGACSVVTTKGFISVGITPTYFEPDEIEVSNANGDLCISDLPKPQLKWNELEIVMCNVDPDAYNILTGDPLVLDDTAPTPNTVGFRQEADADSTSLQNFALELWAGKPGQPCVDGAVSTGYFLFPFVVNGILGEFTFENAELTLTMTARTSSGSGWGVGPYNVRADATAGTPEPLLTPIGALTHMHHEVVTIAPPTPVCGCTALP